MDLDELDHLLAEARQNRPDPSAALMARVMESALALQPAPAALAQPTGLAGFWQRLRPYFAGSGLVAAMGCAAAVGLYIGYVDPKGWGDQWLQPDEAGLEIMPTAEYFLFAELTLNEG